MFRFVFVLCLTSFCVVCAQCCLWIIYSWLPLRFSLTFIETLIHQWGWEIQLNKTLSFFTCGDIAVLLLYLKLCLINKYIKQIFANYNKFPRNKYNLQFFNINNYNSAIVTWKPLHALTTRNNKTIVRYYSIEKDESRRTGYTFPKRLAKTTGI